MLIKIPIHVFNVFGYTCLLSVYCYNSNNILNKNRKKIISVDICPLFEAHINEGITLKNIHSPGELNPADLKQANRVLQGL